MEKKLKLFIGGEYYSSKSDQCFPVYDPSTGSVQAFAPACTKKELMLAVECAERAYPLWRDIPVRKRVQVLYKFRDIVLENFDDLVETLCRENGKVWKEAEGDILKVVEITEHACSMPSLIMGESLMDTSKGYDTVLYREPIGVFAAIVPYNFPAMIPMGWMMPLCIASGNTMVIKASHVTPMTSLKMAGLLKQAGLPDGVINIITCSNEEAAYLLEAPAIKGVSFVGSTDVGKHIYKTAAENGKRVQALCEAKNHGLVLEDAPLEGTARAIINASFGCAGQRCMALPVIVVQDSVADKLIELLKEYASNLKIGPAYDKDSLLGPVINSTHKAKVEKWISKAAQEGAEIVLDGRNYEVNGYENGFYVGPTIIDKVTQNMSCGQKEVFGPVLFIKRVKDFEEGIEIINKSIYANGSVIFTSSGYYSREFAKRAHAGMVGINVGIPVPTSVFPFSGHKSSFFGDLHTLGKDGVRFFTESKAVTTRWFDKKEQDNSKIDTWDGSL